MLVGIGVAHAQPYPSRPITMVVPFGAGGPTDALARILGERMRGALGQQVIIENVTGASGNLGVGRVARANPDGYTIVLGNWPSHVVNGAIFTLPYVRNGQVRAYAVTSKTRLAAPPDIPSADEAGAPGVYISTWFGLWAPKGTPPDLIGKLTAAAMDAMADAGVRARLTDLGQEVPPPEQQTARAL